MRWALINRDLVRYHAIEKRLTDVMILGSLNFFGQGSTLSRKKTWYFKFVEFKCIRQCTELPSTVADSRSFVLLKWFQTNMPFISQTNKKTIIGKTSLITVSLVRVVVSAWNCFNKNKTSWVRCCWSVGREGESLVHCVIHLKSTSSKMFFNLPWARKAILNRYDTFLEKTQS